MDWPPTVAGGLLGHGDRGRAAGPLGTGGGTGLLAFGIVWDALTIGRRASSGSTALPRVSRIL
ncbi:MAG: hypothetical protein IT306_26930 [Chloroflexi bacterium]|nr:hypothetical protein [Chloroflexota bacterium]